MLLSKATLITVGLVLVAAVAGLGVAKVAQRSGGVPGDDCHGLSGADRTTCYSRSFSEQLKTKVLLVYW